MLLTTLRVIISLIIVIVMTSPIWLTILVLFNGLGVALALKILVGIISIGFGTFYISEIIDMID